MKYGLESQQGTGCRLYQICGGKIRTLTGQKPFSKCLHGYTAMQMQTFIFVFKPDKLKGAYQELDKSYLYAVLNTCNIVYYKKETKYVTTHICTRWTIKKN